MSTVENRCNNPHRRRSSENENPGLGILQAQDASAGAGNLLDPEGRLSQSKSQTSDREASSAEPTRSHGQEFPEDRHSAEAACVPPLGASETTIPTVTAPSMAEGNRSTKYPNGGLLSFDEVAANVTLFDQALDHHAQDEKTDVMAVPEGQTPRWDPAYLVDGQVKPMCLLNRQFYDILMLWQARKPTCKLTATRYMWWLCGVASVVTVEAVNAKSTMTRQKNNGLDLETVLQGAMALSQAENGPMSSVDCRVSRNGRSYFYKRAGHLPGVVCLAPELFEVFMHNLLNTSTNSPEFTKAKFLYMCGVASQQQPRENHPGPDVSRIEWAAAGAGGHPGNIHRLKSKVFSHFLLPRKSICTKVAQG